ncbi:MAG: hypothetical protein AB1505_28960 [Candidatus Latescibacterota bacterium]
MEIADLASPQSRKVASLLAIGRQSGDTVVGLSAVRRAGPLAHVFVDRGIAPGTLAEMARLAQRGVKVWRVESLAEVTRPFGRVDLLVVGVRRGSLARGVARRLAEGAGS